MPADDGSVRRSLPRVVADGALRWIASHLHDFNPLGDGEPVDEMRQKALVELAIAAMYLRLHSPFATDRRVNEIFELLLRTHRRGFFQDAVFRVPNLFVPHVLLWATLRACGLVEDAGTRRAFERLVATSNVGLSELVPYRVLELRHVLELGGIAHSLPGERTLFAGSLLAQPLNILYVADADAYAITHTVFYLSDFSTSRIRVLGPSDVKRVAWIVEQLLGMEIRRRNLDLVGELLLAEHSLRQGQSPFYAIGWRALERAQWHDGAVPGPRLDLQRATDLEEAERGDYLFEQNYHTTLVAALSGGLCPAASGDGAGA
jgi:hypothetical protein